MNIHTHNLHFMHINKTAGTSVHEWFLKNFNKYDLKSATPKDEKNNRKKQSGHEIVTEFKDDIFYFTIVRNPYDRIASHYFQWTTYEWGKPIITDINSYVRQLSSIETEEDMKQRHLNSIIGR